jgi:hypothetical protein
MADASTADTHRQPRRQRARDGRTRGRPWFDCNVVSANMRPQCTAAGATSFAQPETPAIGALDDWLALTRIIESRMARLPVAKIGSRAMQ